MIFQLENHRDNVAFMGEDHSKILYKDLLELSRCIEKTIGEGNLILLLASNSMGALAYYVSLLYTGNIVMPVSEAVNEKVIKGYLERYQPDYICCAEKNTLLKSPKKNMLLSSYGYCLIQGYQEVKKEIYHETALLLPTSGSTGNHKFVRQSRENIISNAEAIIEFLEITASDRPVLALPMTYTYGLSVIHTHLYQGATILVPQSGIYQKGFWQFFAENEGTSFSGVPYSYEVLDRMGFYSMELPSLKCMTQSGGRLSAHLQERLTEFARQREIKFFLMYGQTEATARMTYLPYQLAWKGNKTGSVGIPIAGAKIRLYTEDEKEVTEAYQPGELYFYGKSVSLGYAENYKDLALANVNRYCLKSGDIAYKDEEGCYYICGRKSRFVKILGIRTNLDDIERLLQQQFPMLTCAVTGNDKKIVVWVEDSCSDDIEGYLERTIKINRCFLERRDIKKLPRAASGKLLYSDLE